MGGVGEGGTGVENGVVGEIRSWRSEEEMRLRGMSRTINPKRMTRAKRRGSLGNLNRGGVLGGVGGCKGLSATVSWFW